MPAKKELNGLWQFRERGKGKWQEARVPGCVQMDLMALGKLPDPFYRMNEKQFIDLEPREWDYRKEFVMRKEDLSFSSINLIFQGLDTFSNIYLNDKYLGRAENMFIPHAYNVFHILQEGENTLLVRFDSPIQTIKAIENSSSLFLASSAETARPYVRKAQYSYGWDWGPRIAQTGIWKEVYLEFIDRAKLQAPFIYTEEITKGSASLNISCEVLSYTEERLEIGTTIFCQGKKITSFNQQVENIKGVRGISRRIMIKNPHLWYPQEMGKQNLYQAHFSLFCRGKEVDTLKITFGIRTVRLIQEEDSQGKSFIFEINGVKTFCKGANWIPADNLLPRITKEDYMALISLAKDAHMNMLRVWGGGIYEDDEFYNLCDEKGIMVWQDFMYACAQYPDEFDWFQKLAREEAIQVVKRLRNHPSLVLWCGNNENNWGFHSWWKVGEPKFLGNYVYKEILPRICAENDPSRPYWVSSPYGGKDPNSEKEGDRHSWDVWSGWQDYELYTKEKGRFLSEFGFQAMPTWKTLLSFTKEEDRHLSSGVVRCHNKMPEGMERLIRFVVGRIGLPLDFRNFCYLTQLNQAEAIKTGVEHARSRKFQTSGTLFWQFNDCWPVASWSCVDYYKRKKALWYYAKKFFAPILPYLRFEDNKVSLSIVNDFTESKNAQVSLRAYKLEGKKVWEGHFRTQLRGNEVVRVKTMEIAEFVKKEEKYLMVKEVPGTNAPSVFNKELLDTVLFVDVMVDNKIYHNYLVFDRFRSLKIRKAKIEITQKNKRLNIVADRPVFGLFIEPEADVDISDNCLILEPGKHYEITFSDNPGKIEIFDLKRGV